MIRYKSDVSIVQNYKTANEPPQHVALLRGTMRLLVLMLIAVLLAPLAKAQYNSGIRGIVSDKTGAVIPGAKVSMVNASTGVSHEMTSSETGAFQFLRLAPGEYLSLIHI